MKRLIVSVLAVLAVALPLALSSAVPANASTLIGIRQLCTDGPDRADQCANNWNGDNGLVNRNPVNFWVSGNTFNNWGLYFEGKVVGQNCGQPGQPQCWPFNTGSGLNSIYNNDSVYGFTWYSSKQGKLTTFCMDGGGYNPNTGAGFMYIYQCLGNQNQMFVFFPANDKPQDYNVVNVGATQRGLDAGEGFWPGLLGCRFNNCDNGQPVMMNYEPSYAQDWKFEGQV